MKLKKLLFGLLVALMVCQSFSLVAFAAPSENKEILVVYQDEQTPIMGCEFRLFSVAFPNENGMFVLTDAFQNYPIKMQAETFHQLTYTLEGYVGRDGIVPNDIQVTNQEGIATFSSLKSGIYLILSERHIQNNHAYETQPFLIYVTQEQEVVRVFPKSESEPPHPTEETYCKVLKVWDDAGYTSSRPQSVEMQLLKDGEVFDTVTLSKENNWAYTWKGLDPTCRYVVVEKESCGYYPVVSYEGITYVVVNTVNPELPPTPQDPTPPDPQNPDQPKPDDKLPQTGQLWWPVPMFFILGLLSLIVGLLRRRGVQ